MSIAERRRWDEHFSQIAHKAYPAPDPLLLQFTPQVDDMPQRALDLAAGVGQNGLWLAEQRYSVDLYDISRVALGRARAEMGLRNLRNVNLHQVDLDTLQLNGDAYNIVVVFRYLKRHLFTAIKQAVSSGGRVVYETYNVRYLEQVPAFNPDFLLNIDELGAAFSDWQILHYEEVDHRTQLVAIRP